MCLNCSGVHRGLGVHITFIRSVTMDAFKVSEVKRMQLGGNKPWREFFERHADNRLAGLSFDDATIKDRYESDVGEEWKERLSAKVEGREYVPGAKVPRAAQSQMQTPSGASSRAQTPAGARDGGAARASTPLNGTRKAQNESYFARMGAANADRPDGMAPSQGGKYAGFGNEPAPTAARQDDADWLGTFQRDPMAGLTKGFGWLGKSAKTLNDGWVKPNLQKVCRSKSQPLELRLLTRADDASWRKPISPRKRARPRRS